MQNIMFDSDSDFNSDSGSGRGSGSISDPYLDSDNRFNINNTCRSEHDDYKYQEINQYLPENNHQPSNIVNYINDNSSVNVNHEDGHTSDSDISIKLTKKHIRTINLSDDSEEWDDLDENNDNNSALPDTESDESSDNEIDLWSYTQQFKNLNKSEKFKSNEQPTNNISENFSEGNLSDDEISRALKEYKENIKENSEISQEEQQIDSKFNSSTNSNIKSRNIFDFLKDDTSESSKETEYPLYEKYSLFWNIQL